MTITGTALATVTQLGGMPFDLDGTSPIVAYVNDAGCLICPDCMRASETGHPAIAWDADNSAAWNDLCDRCRMPIAAIVLAARAAEMIGGCFGCATSYRDSPMHLGIRCAAHRTAIDDHLATTVREHAARIF